MKNIKEKIEASLMLSSYFETIGFKNGSWEFNYRYNIKTVHEYTSIMSTLLNHYLILGGNMIDITGFNSSDDTILLIATAEAVIEEGGLEMYKKYYVDNYELLLDEKRASGEITLSSIKLLKQNRLPSIKETMGGNGAAMRTGPIGLRWYKDYDKVIEESIVASMLTHNYYIGFLGGMVVALFTSFAMNNIKPWKWIDSLLSLYDSIKKYYPKEHNIEDLDVYISYWKRYKETRLSKLKYKNSLYFFIFPEDRAEYLLGFSPIPKIKNMVMKGQRLNHLTNEWSMMARTGIDTCIYAYDCILMSLQSPNNKVLDFDDITYNFNTFMTLVCIHPGDNDTTAAIGGTWIGALLGYADVFDKSNLKKLEFYKELKKVSDKMITI
jgi:ADP-ribosylarginine hydrolase